MPILLILGLFIFPGLPILIIIDLSIIGIRRKPRAAKKGLPSELARKDAFDRIREMAPWN